MRKVNNEGRHYFYSSSNTHNYWGHQIKEDEVGGTFDTWEWEYKSIQSLLKAEGNMSHVTRRRRRDYNIKTGFRGLE